MHYRPIQGQQELAAYREMTRLAFNLSIKVRESWESDVVFTSENSRGLFSGDGTLLTGLRILDNGALYFRSERPVPTALISSVVSSPEHRRKGYIKELFLGLYAEQREKGVALSALYPFYFPFYRGFGYELAHDSAQYTVNISQFKPWRKASQQGRFAPATLENDLESLNAMYTAWAQRNLGVMARGEKWWRRKLMYHRELIPAYVYYATTGRAAGYIIYRFEDKGNWQRDMIIEDMLAVDRAAQEALYGFIYNHDSQAEKVIFSLPVDAGFASQIPDPREADVHIHPGYMLRLLDVAESFRQRDFVPEAQGSFTFTVADEMLPANSGSYRAQVRDGKAEVKKLAGDGEEVTGLWLDTLALAQSYGGYASPMRLAALGRIKVSREDDLRGMQAVLSPCGQPAPYMADHF